MTLAVRRNELLTAMDLFCGCGGLSIGLRKAGFDVRLGVDCENIAVESYNLNRRHHRSTAVVGDLFEMSAEDLAANAGLSGQRLDLLAGCPPCQGFSSVATRRVVKERTDNRNNLVARFGDICLELRPRAVMMENVPGLASNWRFVHLVRRLRGAGYRVVSRIEDAQDYGVPQRRKRLLMIAVMHHRPCLAMRKIGSPKTVRSAIEWLPKSGQSGDPLHDTASDFSDSVLARIKATPRDGGSRADVVGIESLACHQKVDGFRDVYGRMAWDQVSPTITGGCFNPSKGRFLHPEEDRAISMREALLLQGFPISAIVSLRRGKTGAALMIGNAFPPALAAAHARPIAKQLSIIKESV